jgi:hypothetical protein
MNGFIASCSSTVCLSSAIALLLTGNAVPGSMTPAQAEQAAQTDVIVILRDQLANAPPVRRAMGARATAVAAAQSPVITQLQRMRARKVTSFSTINAFATTVSAAEAAQLAAHPMVQSVVPDRVIRAQRHGKSGETAGGGTAAAAGANGLCGTLEPEALQLTNTAFLNSSTPQAQEVRDGNGKPVTGQGVKVAFLADGLDPNIAGFIRPDGSHVFIDYQDFSGDPAGTPTAGGEAFGDASSIAAQDNPKGRPLFFDIGKFVNAAHPLPSPCDIRIRGMAPGASLVGLKVFSSLGYTTNSAFVQAIEYAVVHDDVDVINESFGGNVYPDTANDPTSLANAAAVAAGVTVVVSTGDAGSAGTLGSPSTDPFVISVGATTQFRLYAQTAQGAQPLAKGYVSNNISSLSSGGFAQNSPRTVDVVAPGDLGWALCSTNTALYNDCVNFVPGPTPIQDFGGTSESAPLTSGEAALIIQAYRSTHRGADPSPALVKRIIMSTATDLGAPAFEQGAGLINSLAAVNVALSVENSQSAQDSPSTDDSRSADDSRFGEDWRGRSKPHHGDGLLLSRTSAEIVSSPNSRESATFRITNTGSTVRHLTPALETLGAPLAGATLDLRLSPGSDPTFINPSGVPRSYIEHKFSVPANAEHLDAAIAYQVSLTSSATPIAYIALLDPSGRQAAYSIPQGFASGYGHVDIVKPAAGTWTAVIWTRPSGVGSYSGPVQFTWAAERFVKLGTVSPAKLHLAPGASASFKAEFFMPTESGDSAAAVRFNESEDGSGTTQPEIPVILRTLVPTTSTGGSFTGTLTGGNGRAGAGPTQTFEFDVPQNRSNMSLVLQIPDNGYLLEGLLVDPQGMQLSVQGNLDPSGAPQFALQQFRSNPQPGRWKFVLVQNFTSSGNQTSLPFTARIGFDNAQVTFAGLPDKPSSTVSASGAPVTFSIEVTNSGAVTQAYFADARLSTLGVTSLAQLPCGASPTLPGTCGLFFLPTQVSSIQFVAQSTAQIQMDAYNEAGFNVGGTFSPDIFAKRIAPGTVVASLLEPEIPFGPWVVAPALIGPFGTAGAPTKPVAMSAFALMQPFDPAMSADSGDIWADLTLGSNTYNPLVLAPGEKGTISVTITPNVNDVGKTMTGYIYVDTFNANVLSGDEVVRQPYSYTVAP